MMITPAPAFVLKSSCVAISNPNNAPRVPDSTLPKGFSSGGKVFINITSHDAVPGLKSVEQPADAKSTEPAQQAVNIPIAVGPIKSDVDKSGAVVAVVDMAVNPSVALDCDRDGSGSFRHWVCHLAMQYLERKHGLTLNPQYRLPAMKYKGAAITSQRIRRPKGYQIQEVATSTAPGSTPSSSTSSTAPLAPMHILSEAGALPAAATAVTLSSRGAGTSAPGRSGSRLPPAASSAASGMPAFDIRVVGQNDGSGDGSVAEAIGREAAKAMGAGAGGASNDSHAARKLKISQEGTDTAPAIGMTAVASTRLPKLAAPVVSVAVSLAAQSTVFFDSSVRDSGSEQSADGGSGGPSPDRPGPRTVSCSMRVDGAAPAPTAPASQAVTLHADLPRRDGVSAAASGDSAADADEDDDEDNPPLPVAVSLTVTFPEPPMTSFSSLIDPPLPPLLPSSITVKAAGAGDVITLAAPGYRRTIIHLPCACQVVAGGGGANGSSAAQAVSARFDPEYRTLTLRLTARRDHAALLPPLPPRNHPSFLEILRKHYVESGAGQQGHGGFAPDPGSKPWLLAQALATDDAHTSAEEGPATQPQQQRQTSSSSSSSLSASADQEDQQQSYYAEDAFLASDALSQHYLRMREEDKKKAAAKEEERQRQRVAEGTADKAIVEEVYTGTAADADNPADLIKRASSASKSASTVGVPAPPSSNAAAVSAIVVDSNANEALLYDLL